jgi:hypothetical protein
MLNKWKHHKQKLISQIFMPPHHALPPKDKAWRAILSDFVEIAFRYEYRNGLKCGGMHKTRKETGQTLRA